MPNMSHDELSKKFHESGPGFDREVMENFSELTDDGGSIQDKQRRIFSFVARNPRRCADLKDFVEALSVGQKKIVAGYADNPEILGRLLNSNNLNADILLEIAKNAYASKDILSSILDDEDEEEDNINQAVLLAIAKNENADAEVLKRVVEHPEADKTVLEVVAQNPKADEEVLLAIFSENEEEEDENDNISQTVLLAIAENENSDGEVLQRVISHPATDKAVLKAVVRHPMSEDLEEEPVVLQAVAQHSNVDEEVLLDIVGLRKNNAKLMDSVLDSSKVTDRVRKVVVEEGKVFNKTMLKLATQHPSIRDQLSRDQIGMGKLVAAVQKAKDPTSISNFVGCIENPTPALASAVAKNKQAKEEDLIKVAQKAPDSKTLSELVQSVEKEKLTLPLGFAVLKNPQVRENTLIAIAQKATDPQLLAKTIESEQASSAVIAEAAKSNSAVAFSAAAKRIAESPDLARAMNKLTDALPDAQSGPILHQVVKRLGWW